MEEICSFFVIALHGGLRKQGWFHKDKKDWSGLVEKMVQALQEKNGENTRDEVNSPLRGKFQEVRPRVDGLRSEHQCWVNMGIKSHGRNPVRPSIKPGFPRPLMSSKMTSYEPKLVYPGGLPFKAEMMTFLLFLLCVLSSGMVRSCYCEDISSPS